MRHRALLLCGVLAACSPWYEDYGPVELPALPRPVDSVTPTLLESAAGESRSLDESLRDLKEREPVAKGARPRALQRAEGKMQSLTLAHVRAMVLRNNLELDVELYRPELAAARLGGELGRFDALIGSRFRFADVETPAIDGPLADLSATDPALSGRRVKLTEVEQRRRRLDLGFDVRVPLPTGGALGLETFVDEKTVTDPQRFEQYLAATRFSFSQPLLRNAGNVAVAGVRVARVDQRIARVKTKLAALRVLSRAEKAYWRLYASRRVLDVRSEQFRLAKENLELVRRRVGAGLTPRVEIVRAEVGVYSRLENLVIAETDWRLRQRELKAFLNSERFPVDGEAMIEVGSEPRLAGLELDADALEAQALRVRPDLIELELAVLRDGIRLEQAENRVLPIVNLDFEYGLSARGANLGRAWESQWGLDRAGFGAGISFALPLTNRLAREGAREALLLQSQRMASRRARELRVRVEVRNGIDVITRNWQRVVAARQNVVVAGVNYDAERRQFEQGLRTMREVLEALDVLGAAQLREVRAIVDYQAAQIDLSFASGTLLGYSRVELEPLPLPTRGDRTNQ